MSLGHILAIPVLAYILIPMPKRIRYAMALFLVGGLYIFAWPNIYKTYRLEKEGQHAAGIVLSKTCKFKGSQVVSYRFHANGKAFTGIGSPGKGNQTCEAFQVGDQIFVTYIADDPNVSKPEREVDSDIFIGLIFTAGLCGALIWINGEQTRFWAEKRAKRKKNA